MKNKIELFAINGPTLFGCLWGLWKYPFKHPLFFLSLQNFFIVSLYLLSLGVLYLFSFIVGRQYLNIIYYIDSILCIIYLLTTLYGFEKAIKNKVFVVPLFEVFYKKIRAHSSVG